MGIRRKKIVLSIEHCVSKINIKNCLGCSNCPIRLYADEKDTIILGTGNICSNIIMILPSYDVHAGIDYITILTLLQNAYRDITGKELLDDCYVTRYIKCLDKTDRNLNNTAVKHCLKNLYYEINKIKPKKVISFNKEYVEYIERITDYGIELFNVISPGVMYYNNDKLKNVFMKQLKEAIDDY